MSKEILVAILTDRYPEKLERAIKSIDQQNIEVGKIVVCNTLDTSYVDIARTIVESYGWQFVVTESDGTCSKGKNSVLDHFRNTDYKYLSLIDGDDYYEPNSLTILHKIIEKYYPDVLGLIGSSAIVGTDRITLDKWMTSRDWIDRTKSKISSTKNARKLISLYERARKILEFNRFVLINRDTLDYFRFSEKVHISDLLLSIKLKHYVNNGICNYIILKSDNIYTYDGNDFGDFARFLQSDPNISTVNFWKELENLDLSGNIKIIEEIDVLQDR
jgi:hypothetical protein